jgi:hypothetical protein
MNFLLLSEFREWILIKSKYMNIQLYSEKIIKHKINILKMLLMLLV